MIKKIAIEQLEPGMFVHDLDANWLSHDFLRTQFPVNETQIIQKIAGSGIKYLYIDTNKGDDVDDALTVNEVNTQIDREVVKWTPWSRQKDH